MDYENLIKENPELKRWQYCVAGLLWLPTLSAGLNIMSYTFAGYQPPFRCDISCEEKSEINLDNKTWYQKLDTSKINPQCEFFKYNPPDSYEGGCQAEYFSESDVVPCRHFVYDQSIFEETLVTNFDLVCSDTWKKGFVGTVYMVGLFIGSYIIGYAGDRWGRKLTMMISLLFLILGGTFAGVMPYYSLYVVCYVIGTIAGYGMFVLPFLITVELLPTEKKTFISMMINFPFVIGEALMCVIAWLTKNYRIMHLAGYLPLLALFPLWFLIPESPRWLLAKGRVEDVKKEIRYGARWMKIHLNSNILQEDCVDGLEESTNLNNSTDDCQKLSTFHKEVGFLDILKSRTMLIRLLVNYINWAVINLCYYGLTMNSVNLHGNTFLNTLLGVLIEAPGYLLAMLTMDRFGRKPILVLCQILSGLACIGAGVVSSYSLLIQDSLTSLDDAEKDNFIDYLLLSLSCVGKLGSSAAFSLIYLYTAEMFPTEVRTKALGTCSMVARVGSFISPYIASLGSSAQAGYIPFLIFGISTLLGGSTAILLPETIGTQLPVTIKEAEEMKKMVSHKPGCTVAQVE